MQLGQAQDIDSIKNAVPENINLYFEVLIFTDVSPRESLKQNQFSCYALLCFSCILTLIRQKIPPKLAQSWFYLSVSIQNVKNLKYCMKGNDLYL